MNHPIACASFTDFNLTDRWNECVVRNNVTCWRALAFILRAYSRLEDIEQRFAVGKHLRNLANEAQREAIKLAPFDDRKLRDVPIQDDYDQVQRHDWLSAPGAFK